MALSLTLAHSPDPDDAFMWWPLTGKIEPPVRPWQATDSIRHARVISPPVLAGGPFSFGALPADIEALNRRAVSTADLDVTALSARTWADVQDRYIITSCGASFGDGYGPRLVARADDARLNCHNCLRPPTIRIAIPGRRTTAFLMLGLVLGLRADADLSRFVEVPFDQVIGAVARGEVDAGLVIHEGQLAFADAGLKLVLDIGQWWKQKTGLKLPLGVNAIRRDLDRHGPGTVSAVAGMDPAPFPPSPASSEARSVTRWSAGRSPWPTRARSRRRTSDEAVVRSRRPRDSMPTAACTSRRTRSTWATPGAKQSGAFSRMARPRGCAPR